ncbi:MAG TPA: YkgJ family cysteine cluster protein [bacterium]|nr:YkgJ family cysteine cluster protein [bacterium]HPJ71973.1 YkgJ family cysteine cluster protein [bacterium]HPQ65614.1 YkgJ family cysteine cluster protein [bacterium]
MNSSHVLSFDPEPGDGDCCRGCDACCRWEGTVFFPPENLPGIARWLGMDERECAETYFEPAPDRRRLQAVETADGRCPFLGADGCRIYPLRPPACRSFPYRWQRPEPELMRQCRLWRTLLWRAARRGDRPRT